MRKIPFVALTSLLMLAAAPAAGEEMGFRLTAIVPVTCQVSYQMGSFTGASGGGVDLGSLKEYCNAPSGYQLTVKYTPGTLRGATVILGGDQVTLNGSGEAVLSTAPGPRWRSRPLAAVPGDAGFDTEMLVFDMRPS